MLTFFITILFSLVAFAAKPSSSQPPRPNLPKDYTVIQQNTPCRPVEGNWKFTAIAYDPQYDANQQLTMHNKTSETFVDGNFQDVPSNRNGTLPKGWIAHDSVAKVSCKDGYYIEQPSNVNIGTIDYAAQRYFLARCSNGYMKTCHTADNNHQDPSLSQYYTKYTQDATRKKCLNASRDELLRCRKMCDVTRIQTTGNYQISQTPVRFDDFIGFNNTTAQEQYVTYYYLRPQNNINVQCINNTFVAHSTSENNKFTSFVVSCNAEGYVTYPAGDGESTCVDVYACAIPSDTASTQWGLYRDGRWTNVNKIIHGAYIYVHCSSSTEEKFATCVNGKLFPTADFVCQG